METATGVPAAKLPWHETDYQRCIICQTETDQELVVAPTSQEKVLNFIRVRAAYGEGNFS